MGTPYYLLYHECSLATGLEWATKYHVTDAVASGDVASELMAAELELLHTSVEITRWQFFNALGHQAGQGGWVLQNGAIGGEMMPIHYALLIRVNVIGGTGRPSVRYIHGWSETFQAGGDVTAAFNTARAAYNSALLAVGSGSTYCDSDGHIATGHGFRGFSRRKRMRRKEI